MRSSEGALLGARLCNSTAARRNARNHNERKTRERPSRGIARFGAARSDRKMNMPLMIAVLAGDVWVPKLTPTPLTIAGDSAGGFVPEFWGNVAGVRAVGQDKLIVQGNNRLYAVASIPPRPEPEYVDITYKKFDLFNRELTFDVDMSGVGCGCNAAACESAALKKVGERHELVAA